MGETQPPFKSTEDVAGKWSPDAEELRDTQTHSSYGDSDDLDPQDPSDEWLSEVLEPSDAEQRDDDEDLQVHWMDEGFVVGPPAGAWRADRRRAILAWTLAILLHGLLLFALIQLHDRFLGLRIFLSRGTTAVAGEAGAADTDAPTGPLLPESPAVSADMHDVALPPPAAESTEDRPPQFTAAPIPQSAPPVEEHPAAPPLGFGPPLDSPLPHFASRALPLATPFPAGTASPSTAPSIVPLASAAAGGGAGAQVFKPPHPNGGGGVVGDPDGVDERGLPIPEYPAQSRRRHEEGLVEVDVQVLPDGTVGAVRVITDPGYPRLVQSAIAAARKARFDPALRDGRPVIASLIVPYRFILR